ncbi:DUF4349 domain-containing protein [Desulfurispora thermophila]|uniref:DUF4349 domain-containing protein n=1 Tax=Desulfurispora thermophila TaxID=265470 RepID=UPI0009FDC769|nr:DUF4349 domain-containing protein [Desulfurispora thermophila]
MDCNQICELLSEYIDHQLPPSMAATVEEHLAKCPGCKKEYMELRRVVESLRNLPAVLPPQEFHHRLHQALSVQYTLTGSSASSGFWSRLAKSKWFKTAAVAAVALLSFGMFNLSDFRREPVAKSPQSTVAERQGTAGEKALSGSGSGVTESQPPTQSTSPSELEPRKLPRGDSAGTVFSSPKPAKEQNADQQREGSAGSKAGGTANQIAGSSGQQAAQNPADAKTASTAVTPKVIRQAVLSLAVSDVDDVTEAVSQLAWRNGGLVAVQGDSDNASMVLKVPVSKFDKVFDVLQNMGIVMDKKLIGQDVTSDYYQAVNSLQELERKQPAEQGVAQVASAEPDKLQQEKVKAENKLRSLEDAITMATIQVKINE